MPHRVKERVVCARIVVCIEVFERGLSKVGAEHVFVYFAPVGNGRHLDLLVNIPITKLAASQPLEKDADVFRVVLYRDRLHVLLATVEPRSHHALGNVSRDSRPVCCTVLDKGLGGELV